MLAGMIKFVSYYNSIIFPLQVVAYLLGLTAIMLAVKKTAYSGRLVAGILVLLFLWVGIVFNGMYFQKIFPPATVLAVLFVLQALLFLIWGVIKPSINFDPRSDASGWIGGLLMFYAMIGYPVLEALMGRGYPATLPFGLAPCPTATFTLGLLLWADEKLPKGLLVIPILFAVFFGAFTTLTVFIEDAGLVLAGVVTFILVLVRSRRAHTVTPMPMGTPAQ